MRTLSEYIKETGQVELLFSGLQSKDGESGLMSRVSGIERQAKEFNEDNQFDIVNVLNQLGAAHEKNIKNRKNSRLALIAGGSIGRHEFCDLDSDIDLLPLDLGGNPNYSAKAVANYCTAIRQKCNILMEQSLSSVGSSRDWDTDDLSIATLPLVRDGKKRDFYTLDDLFGQTGSDYEPAWASGLRGLVLLDGIILHSKKAGGFDNSKCQKLKEDVKNEAEKLLGLEEDLAAGFFPVRFLSFVKDQAGSQALSEVLNAKDGKYSYNVGAARYCTRRLFNGWINRLLVHLLFFAAFTKQHLELAPGSRDWNCFEANNLLIHPYKAFRGGVLYKSMVNTRVLAEWIGKVEVKRRLRYWIEDLHPDAVIAKSYADRIEANLNKLLMHVSINEDETYSPLFHKMLKFWLGLDRVRRNEPNVVFKDGKLADIENSFRDIMYTTATISRDLSGLLKESQQANNENFLKVAPSVFREGVLQ